MSSRWSPLGQKVPTSTFLRCWSVWNSRVWKDTVQYTIQILALDTAALYEGQLQPWSKRVCGEFLLESAGASRVLPCHGWLRGVDWYSCQDGQDWLYTTMSCQGIRGCHGLLWWYCAQLPQRSHPVHLRWRWDGWCIHQVAEDWHVQDVSKEFKHQYQVDVTDKEGGFLPGVLQIGIDDSSLELQAKLDKEYRHLVQDCSVANIHIPLHGQSHSGLPSCQPPPHHPECDPDLPYCLAEAQQPRAFIHGWCCISACWATCYCLWGRSIEQRGTNMEHGENKCASMTPYVWSVIVT